jgi:hypothetical protein
MAWAFGPFACRRKKKKPQQGFGGASSMRGAETQGNPALATTLALIAAEIKAGLWKQFFIKLRCCFWVTPKQSENAYHLTQLQKRN